MRTRWLPQKHPCPQVPEASRNHPSRWSGNRELHPGSVHPESRSRQRGDSSAKRVLVVVTPHALLVVRVDPELQADRSRVQVVLGQLSAVNLRDRAQRLTLLIGRRQLAGGQVRAATKLGCGLRQRASGQVTFRRIACLRAPRSLECVDDAACLCQGLFGGLVLRHCARFVGELIGVWNVSAGAVPLRLLPPLDPISGGHAPIPVTGASSGSNRVGKQVATGVQKAPPPSPSCAGMEVRTQGFPASLYESLREARTFREPSRWSQNSKRGNPGQRSGENMSESTLCACFSVYSLEGLLHRPHRSAWTRRRPAP